MHKIDRRNNTYTFDMDNRYTEVANLDDVETAVLALDMHKGSRMEAIKWLSGASLSYAFNKYCDETGSPRWHREMPFADIIRLVVAALKYARAEGMVTWDEK